MKRWEKKNRPSRAAAITLSGGVSYAEGDLGESFHRRASGRVAASLLVGPLRKVRAHILAANREFYLFIYLLFPRQLGGAQAFPHG